MKVTVGALAALALSTTIAAAQFVSPCDYPPIPERFDFVPQPYPEIIKTTPGNLWAYCRDKAAIACATNGLTAVAMIDDDAMRGLGFTEEQQACVLRHELAHINGWPADHPP